MKYYFQISLLCLILCSCKTCKENGNQKLCSDANWYSGNELRLDGYYYSEYNDPPRRKIFFLYRNGVMFDGELVPLDELEAKEESYSNGEYYRIAKDFVSKWGHYSVSNGKLKFEKWYPSNRYIAYVNDGLIINDSTFHIAMSYRCDGSNFLSENVTYHFKKFGPKPDSTNQYIP